MTQQYVMVVDMGSSGLRAHAVPTDCLWDVSPAAAFPYGIRRGQGDLSQYLPPRVLTGRLLDVVRLAVHKAGAIPSDITAISITAQRGGTAFVDANGDTLYVGPSRDLRAVFEGAALDDQYGPDIYTRTGHLPSMFFTPAKLRWWQEHRPRIASRIHRVMTMGAWAVHQLTGESAETGPSLGEAGLADIHHVPPGPPVSLLARLGVDLALVPRIIPSGTPTGQLSTKAAENTGLPAGLPVFLTGPDAQAALLGMGAVRPGATGIIAGSSIPVQRVTEAPVLDLKRRTWAGFHLLDGRWVAEANASDAGAAVDAVRRFLRLSHVRFNAGAAAPPENAETAMAFWGPRALDLSSPGMSLGGLLMPVPVTQQGLDTAAVAYASFRNVAFAIRECVETLDEVTGPSQHLVTLSGGMAAASAFPPMLAAALGRPVRLQPPTASVTSAAIVASRHPIAWPDAARQAALQAVVLEPDQRSSLEYNEAYRKWLQVRARLDDMADYL